MIHDYSRLAIYLVYGFSILPNNSCCRRERCIMKFVKIMLFLLGACLIIKAGSLYWTYFNFFDGDGIGIYLFGLEINDKVPIGHVPVYAAAIALLGMTLILPVISKFFNRTHYDARS
jgi:hypothetical protein